MHRRNLPEMFLVHSESNFFTFITGVGGGCFEKQKIRSPLVSFIFPITCHGNFSLLKHNFLAGVTFRVIPSEY
jgi:hypothetical protein